MSFRLGLSPRLFSRPTPFLSSPSAPSLRPSSIRPYSLYNRSSTSHIIARVQARSAPRSNLKLYTFGLGLSFIAFQSIHSSRPLACESQVFGKTDTTLTGRPKPEVFGGELPNESQISLFQLGFGSVAGICTGVFIKKGLKAIAFLLGGAFVLLQYLSSKSFINVDWAKLTGSYNKTFGTKIPATGEVRMPSVGGAWAWMVDFLTANFQQRATFLAGLMLGLRLG
ncbi:FUN14 family-domain-containing protein [Kockovaella imperatae]|uniref:FUN14 family-domain-containing protein n=1 Tax=Kockovaella imperatae TaxID=4999 RepID=A0A1Y1U736_9TREE|nr:FUN14 family-domain-containing protein [Kockovaella imperatae]ORX33812.1 FUN14 family-domain-containing protein [Kockovaella imperatae]